MFWYKPSSSHKHLYPVIKDAQGQPVECIVDGEVAYQIDPNGIEIFKTVYVPPLAWARMGRTQLAHDS